MAPRPLLSTPRLLADLPERSVVVIAPHMDDEAIGCGGTIVLHQRAGAEVTPVFLTDGAQGRPNGAPVGVRHEEAARVADYLGMRAPRFLEAPDTALAADDHLVDGLRMLLDQLAPELLYVPWIGDAHRDHVEANALVAAAIRGSSLPSDLRVRSYEVWAPLPADVAVDISAVMNRKLQALQMYRSQFVAHDPAPIVGLNRYRSMGVGTSATTHVECFAERTAGDYIVEVEAHP